MDSWKALLVFPRISFFPLPLPVLPGRTVRGWGGPRVGPGMCLGCRELPDSRPLCSLSPLPLTPKPAPLASLQPYLAQSNPSWAPCSLPPSIAHRGAHPAAHCQVQRIKISSGKTRGSRSNINLLDLACWPRCSFPGYLGTNMQLVAVSSPSNHHCDPQTFTHRLPTGSTHLRPKGAGPASPFRPVAAATILLPPSRGASLELSGFPGQPALPLLRTAPLTLWGRSSWVPQVSHQSAAKSSSLRIRKEARQAKGRE